jgi:hypothetical protein
MTTVNSYATLAEYKAFVTARGQTSSTDTADDAVIERLLKASSRYIDNACGRFFYPYVQKRYFSLPDEDDLDLNALKMDADLLEVISITNGDDTDVPSTEYTLRPRNQSPYLYVRMIDNSTYYWTVDSAGDTKDVIEITGIWGFHNRYSAAWMLGSTAAEAMDASETGYDVTSGTLFSIGDLIKFDNELGYVSNVVTNTLTNTRGENGSTAATHLTSINVYIWQYMDEVKTATLETAMQAYKRRFGQSSSNIQTVTAAGVVLTPRDIPAMAVDFIRTFRKYT